MLDDAPGLQRRLIVALIAERSAVLRRFERLLRCRGVMACIAAPGSNGIMNARFQQFGPGRSMGVVTHRAGFAVYRITAMRLLKG